MIRVDGEGKPLSWSSSDGRISFSVSTPGRYRMEIPVLPGFGLVEPIELDLIEGEATAVEIPLTRTGR
ncbi:MAG: hypothetical protein ACI9X4_000282 [Glaciecola sp.]